MGRFYNGDIEGKFLFGLEDSLGSLEYGGYLHITFDGIVWNRDENWSALSMSEIVKSIENLLTEADLKYTKEQIEENKDDPSNGWYSDKYTMNEYMSKLSSLKDSVRSMIEEITEEKYISFVSKPDRVDELRNAVVDLICLLNHLQNTSERIKSCLGTAASLSTALNVCHYLSLNNKGNDTVPYNYGTCSFEPEL